MGLCGLQKIVGKEITRVVVKQRENTPKWQLFLLFSDNTYFELYGDEPFAGTKDVDRGGIDDVRRYLDGVVVFDAAAPPSHREPANKMSAEELRMLAPITKDVQ